MDKVLRFYAPGDFHNMAKIGVNTMHIPVPCQVFHDNVVINGDFPHTVSRLLDRAKGARLKVILVLVRGTGEDVLGLGLSMEERREAPLPNNNDNNNKRDSAISRCAFARQFVGLAPVGCPGPVPCQRCVVVDDVDGRGRGRPDNAPSLPSLYNYYAVSILTRFPPRELGMADGGKDDGGDDDDDACGASVAVRNLGI